MKKKPDRSKETRDQLGNSYRFARVNKGKCVAVTGQPWLYWNGEKWARASREKMDDFADSVIRDMRQDEANKYKNEDQTRFLAHITRSSKLNEMRGMTELARKEMVIPCRLLDSDPLLLNTPSGIVDLRTGELSEHDPGLYCTKITKAEYDADTLFDGSDSEFLQVLRHSLPDEEVRNFFQRCLGYSLTGLNSEDVFMLCRGKENSGKSSIFEAIVEALGDYATTPPEKIFDANRQDTAANPEVLNLRGHRFGHTGEVRKVTLNKELVKALAGGDTLSGRYNYSNDTISFRNTVKLWVSTNNQLKIDPDDGAIWRRIRSIDFNVQLKPEEIDEDMGDRLQNKRNLAAILKFAVEGSILYQEQGLKQPEAVKLASQRHRDSEDVIAQFFNEYCHFSTENGHFASSKALKSALISYCEDSEGFDNEPPPGMKSLAPKLKARGCKNATRRISGKVVRGWHGVKIKNSNLKLVNKLAV